MWWKEKRRETRQPLVIDCMQRSGRAICTSLARLTVVLHADKLSQAVQLCDVIVPRQFPSVHAGCADV